MVCQVTQSLAVDFLACPAVVGIHFQLILGPIIKK